MTDDELRQIKARHAVASEGPWQCDHPCNMSRQPWPGPSLIRQSHGGYPVAHCSGSNFGDADFIAASWDDVRRLIAEVERLRKVERLQDAIVAAYRGDFSKVVHLAADRP